MGKNFSESLYDWQRAKDSFEDLLINGGVSDWSDFSGNEMIDRLSVLGVPNGDCLSKEAAGAILDHGFRFIHLHHLDGSYTLYQRGRLDGVHFIPGAARAR